MLTRDVHHVVQAEAEAGNLLLPAAVVAGQDALKLVENGALGRKGNADAVVANADANEISLTSRSNAYLYRFLGVFQCVVYQVGEGFLQILQVAIDFPGL